MPGIRQSYLFWRFLRRHDAESFVPDRCFRASYTRVHHLVDVRLAHQGQIYQLWHRYCHRFDLFGPNQCPWRLSPGRHRPGLALLPTSDPMAQPRLVAMEIFFSQAKKTSIQIYRYRRQKKGPRRQAHHTLSLILGWYE